MRAYAGVWKAYVRAGGKSRASLQSNNTNTTHPLLSHPKTGNCVTNGDLSCTSAASVATLYEATLQGACPKEGQQLPGSGPDFYDLSCVDGYNLPMSVQLVGGTDVPNTPQVGGSILSPSFCPSIGRGHRSDLLNPPTTPTPQQSPPPINTAHVLH